MNKPKPKYRIGWPTNVTVALAVWAGLTLACGNALSGEYWRMTDELCFVTMVLCYWHECYLRTKALNVASDTIRINEEMNDCITHISDTATSLLDERDILRRKVNGMKNAVRVAASLLRLERGLRKQAESENCKLHEKLEAYEAVGVRA